MKEGIFTVKDFEKKISSISKSEKLTVSKYDVKIVDDFVYEFVCDNIGAYNSLDEILSYYMGSLYFLGYSRNRETLTLTVETYPQPSHYGLPDFGKLSKLETKKGTYDWICSFDKDVLFRLADVIAVIKFEHLREEDGFEGRKESLGADYKILTYIRSIIEANTHSETGTYDYILAAITQKNNLCA